MLNAEVYGNRPLPKITFVIIKKSHNTRFFALNGQQIANMAAGTVIDTTIVHPRQFDFYLNSHAGALGKIFVHIIMFYIMKLNLQVMNCNS